VLASLLMGGDEVLQRTLRVVLVLVVGLSINVNAANVAEIGLWPGAGMGFEGDFVDRLFVSVWSTTEDRESPGADVSVTPIKAEQSILAGLYEWRFDGLRLGVGVAAISHRESGTVIVELDGEPKSVPVELRNDRMISPAASVGYGAESGPFWAAARAILSTAGLGWTAQVGWSISTLRIGLGYVSPIGEGGIGAPMLTLGTTF